ncbi:hypothetical protein B0H16DRAFT_1729667 [Mycena metata]|uniref:Uncharacterized protein n=1 Tax=Mycena metata TaxID=1033252 RepID=A0AAD7N0L5_9AGAR|nr:hypothetical protein B0H16DRAFT_1729667 [Mycena metata]
MSVEPSLFVAVIISFPLTPTTISALALHCGHSALYQALLNISETLLPAFRALNPPLGLKFTSTLPRALFLASTPLHPGYPNRWFPAVEAYYPHALLKFLGPRRPCASATPVSVHRPPPRLHPPPAPPSALSMAPAGFAHPPRPFLYFTAPTPLAPTPCASIRLTDDTPPSYNVTGTYYWKSRHPLALCIRHGRFCAPPSAPLAPTPCASIRLIDGRRWLCGSPTAFSAPPAPDRLHPCYCPSIRPIDDTKSSYTPARTHFRDIRAFDGLAHPLRPLLHPPPRTACACVPAPATPNRRLPIVIRHYPHMHLQYLDPRCLPTSATVNSTPLPRTASGTHYALQTASS